jgi:hypothetical protein
MNAVVALLAGAVLGMGSALLIERSEGKTIIREVTVTAEPPSEPGARAPTPTSTTPKPEPKAAAPKKPVIESCRRAGIPAMPTERMECRTSSAVLQIVGQSKPLVVGGTMVRVVSASLDGADLITRIRVRNETLADQGVQAGGQELYLSIAGKRIDPPVLSRARIAPDKGKTVSIRFVLSQGEIEALRTADGAAELGVRPWEDSVSGRVVGVIRLKVEMPPAVTGP